MASIAAPTPRRRIAIFADSVDHLEAECSSLVGSCLTAGAVVLCVAPGLPHGQSSEGALAGAHLADLPINPQAVKPMAGGYTRSTISKLLADWSPDVVLAYRSECLDALSSALKRRRDVLAACFVGDEEAAEQPAKSWLNPWRLPGLLKRCDIVLTSSRACASALLNAWSQRRAPEVQVLPMLGVEVAQLSACSLPRLEPKLTFLLFDDGTDPEFVAAYRGAAARALTQSTAIQFAVATEAPQSGDVRNPDEDDAVVSWTYATGRERDLIAAAHVIVQPGSLAPYPLPFLTALAAGRPVIARDTPAMREAVDEIVNGVLVRDPSVEAIADAAESLLRRPDLLASMARASRTKAERRFDAAVVNNGIRAALGLN